MTGQSLGFVVIETTRRGAEPDHVALCWVLPGSASGICPDAAAAGRERDRLAAHAALDADVNEGVTFSYSVAEVVSRD